MVDRLTQMGQEERLTEVDKAKHVRPVLSDQQVWCKKKPKQVLLLPADSIPITL